MSAKESELRMLHDRIVAILDFHLDTGFMRVKNEYLDSNELFRNQKKAVEQMYQNGQIRRLRQVYRDCLEVIQGNYEALVYISDKAKVPMDSIAKDLFGKIDGTINRIKSRGFVKTPDEYHMLEERVNQLSQEENNKEEIDLLNILLSDYDEKISNSAK